MSEPVNPSLVFAPRAVLRRAEKLLPGLVLENEVTKGILAGRKKTRLDGMPALPTDYRYVVLDDDVAAVVAKGTAVLTARRAWRVVRLVRITRQHVRTPDMLVVAGAATEPRETFDELLARALESVGA